MKKIKLNARFECIVDDSDYHWLTQWKWSASGNDSYKRAFRRSNWDPSIQKMTQTIFMHRLLTNAKSNEYVDHINRDGLDNRRSNLRICTPRQNSHNQVSRGGTSKYKGVSLYKSSGKWLARIMYNYKAIHIGYFDTEEDAAKAYDIAAIKYHGEFTKGSGI